MNILTNWFRLWLSNPQTVILVLTLVLGFAAVLWLGGMVAPILASLIIAYLLDWFVEQCTRIRVSRLLAVVVVYVAFLALLVVSVFAVAPLLSQQATQLVGEIPGFVAELRRLILNLPVDYPEFVSVSQINDLINALGTEIMAFGREMVGASGGAVVGVITLAVYLVLMPMLVFFMLKDKQRLIDWLVGHLPRDHSLLAQVWADVQRQLGNYVRGKIVEIVAVWAVTWATFVALDLRFAALLSFLVGLSVVIPYVGAIAVTFPVVMVAYAQWGFGPDFTWLMVAYLLIHAVDANVLVPLLFSEVVNLHPIAIIAAVLVFGGLWGFWGVFFAIPLAILVQAVLRAWPRTGQIAEAEKEMT